MTWLSLHCRCDWRTAVLVAASVATPFPSHAADEPGSVAEALHATKPIIDLRLRSEQVEQDGFAEEATALTLRARIGFQTGEARHWALLAEAEGVWALESDYNSTVNGKTQFPVVADPESDEINRLAVINSSLPGTTLTLGRQLILHDNQRFVSPADWRQNEQTFDAVRIVNDSVRDLTIDLAYVNQVNRTLGKESPLGRYTGDSYLGNVAWQSSLGRITGFGYLVEFDQAPGDSTSTLGLRYSGEKKLSAVTLAGFATWATQEDRGNNPIDFSDDYVAAELSATRGAWSAGAGIEVLEGDGVKGFVTPLATLHKFQGWADKFTTTPVDGVDDRYLSLTYTRKPLGGLDSLSTTAVWHRFESERNATEYGSEIDLVLQARWRRCAGLLKYADYAADGFATDTRKLWLQFEFVY